MAKNVWLITPGAGDEAEGREAPVETDTRAADLLRALDKDPDRWGLQLQRGDEFIALAGQDKVHGKVKDGDKLHVVSTDMVVGAAA